MRVAVIGLGSIGRRHVGNLLALGCEVDGFDINYESSREAKRQYPAMRLVDECVDGRPDAVVIATPWNQHLDWVQAAVDLGVPFFVEKPLGALSELAEWRRLAGEQLPVNQVGYQQRFQAHAKRLRDSIYPALWIECRVYTDMRTWPGRHYGPFLLECSHEIDLALWCGAGRPIGAKLTPTSAELVFQNGRVDIQAQAPAYRLEWSGIGEAHGYQWAFSAPEDRGDEMYRAELAHFLGCVQIGIATACPLTDGLRVLEVCAQAEALSRS